MSFEYAWNEYHTFPVLLLSFVVEFNRWSYSAESLTLQNIRTESNGTSYTFSIYTSVYVQYGEQWIRCYKACTCFIYSIIGVGDLFGVLDCNWT